MQSPGIHAPSRKIQFRRRRESAGVILAVRRSRPGAVVVGDRQFGSAVCEEQPVGGRSRAASLPAGKYAREFESVAEGCAASVIAWRSAARPKRPNANLPIASPSLPLNGNWYQPLHRRPHRFTVSARRIRNGEMPVTLAKAMGVSQSRRPLRRAVEPVDVREVAIFDGG